MIARNRFGGTWSVGVVPPCCGPEVPVQGMPGRGVFFLNPRLSERFPGFLTINFLMDHHSPILPKKPHL